MLATIKERCERIYPSSQPCVPGTRFTPLVPNNSGTLIKPSSIACRSGNFRCVTSQGSIFPILSLLFVFFDIIVPSHYELIGGLTYIFEREGVLSIHILRFARETLVLIRLFSRSSNLSCDWASLVQLDGGQLIFSICLDSHI